MAVLGSTVLTYADWAKRHDPNGKTAKIIELTSQRNEFFDDAMIREANDGTTHLTTVRTGIPAAAWRMLNRGVPVGKSTTAQVRDTCGMLEAYAEVDKQLAKMSGDERAFRLSEAAAFLEGMAQQVAQTFFYGNTLVNPERFLGLSPRFGSVSTATADSAANVVDGGGTGSTNTSMWFVSWGEHTCHMLYPKGSMAGFTHTDLGEDTHIDAVNNLRHQIYRDHFQHHVGLSVRDWRFMVRLCNLETNGGSAIGASDANLKAFIFNIMEAIERQFKQNDPNSRTAIYCNRYVRTQLRKAIHNQVSQGTLTADQVGGKEVLRLMGHPVRLVEQLLNTEARVV
jgi:hypothetical protein